MADEETAVHEAGHVVVCYASGSVIQTTTVEADEPGQAGCAPCKHRWGAKITAPLVATAGLAAEMLYGPEPRPDASFTEALYSPAGIFSRSDVQGAVRYLYTPETNCGVERPPWCSHRVAAKIIEAGYYAARDFLADWESVVRHVADRLLEDGTLEPSQLYHLLPTEMRETESMWDEVADAWDRAEGEEEDEGADIEENDGTAAEQLRLPGL